MYCSYGEGAGLELTVGGGDRRATEGGDTLWADDATFRRKPGIVGGNGGARSTKTFQCAATRVDALC